MTSKVVTVNGKDYVVNAPKVAHGEGATVAVFYSYWTTRNGEAFGAIRFTNSNVTSKTGRALAAAAAEAFGVDHDQMIADFLAK